jgi:hypothetical protein
MSQNPRSAQGIEADPKDVTTLDGIIRALYEVISGPAGEPRQWDRDRTLWVEGAILARTSVHDDNQSSIEVFTLDAYKEQTTPYLMQGFFEWEIHRVTRTFGNIAHIFSTYEARREPDGPVIARGVNSIELYFDGARWWIVAALWEKERSGNPIPAEFLPG